MREIKFRAWVEETTDNKLDYACDTAEEEFKATKPKWKRWERTPKEWEEWINDKNTREEELKVAWDNKFDVNERYSKSKHMTTDILVNGDRKQRPYGVEVISVMQYTGLKDMNGVEIYEGDIVKGSYWHVLEETNQSFPILWQGEDNGWGNHFNANEVKVIGNIYENKEML